MSVDIHTQLGVYFASFRGTQFEVYHKEVGHGNSQN